MIRSSNLLRRRMIALTIPLINRFLWDGSTDCRRPGLCRSPHAAESSMHIHDTGTIAWRVSRHEGGWMMHSCRSGTSRARGAGCMPGTGKHCAGNALRRNVRGVKLSCASRACHAILADMLTASPELPVRGGHALAAGKIGGGHSGYDRCRRVAQWRSTVITWQGSGVRFLPRLSRRDPSRRGAAASDTVTNRAVRSRAAMNGVAAPASDPR